MAAEIREQPEAWSRFLTHGQDSVVCAARRIAQFRPRHVLFAARGTSDHAALYAGYLFETLLGIPSGLLSPSVLTVYGARPDYTGTLVVGVSQSGGSPDLVRSLAVAGECGALTLAVTNAPDSPLAQTADEHIDVLAGPERAVAATKSYTAQLLALCSLVKELHGSSDQTLRALPDLAHGLLDRQEEPIGRLAERYRFAPRVVAVGRGYSYATAREAALKLMETSYLFALAFSAADLLHGPLAAVDASTPALLVAASGKGGEAARSVLPRLQGQRADIFCVGSPESVRAAGAGIVLPGPVPEEASPLLEILPAQALALRLALLRGENPDSPRGLQKVTKTL
ncbi:MAG: SIS domain-containing protein [Segniliparus sp.]|uniref:SIS domain-containing protein n=1 Tax=Segniliparus sp. TaxID=2804064 RepID=UPI003F419520